MRRLLLSRGLLCVLLAAWTPSVSADERSPTGPLAPSSPLAASSALLFGVAADGHSLLLRDLDEQGAWRPLRLEGPELGHVGGIAADDTALFVADADHATVFRYSLEGKHPVVVLRGGPLGRPGQLAVGRGALVVADDAKHQLLVIPESGEAVMPTSVDLSTVNPIGLAGSPHSLVVGEANAGILKTVSGSGQKWAATPIESDDSPKRITFATSAQTGRRANVTPPVPDSVVGPSGPIAVRDDVVYFVEATRHEIYSTPIQALRPVWSHAGMRAVASPGALVATEDDLWIVDTLRGDVERWPRSVPAEFTFDGPLRSECLVRLYEYLLEQKMLPVTNVPLIGSVEQTLRQAGALRAPYVPALDDVMCKLNPLLCARGRLRSPQPAGTPLTIPAVRVESRLANRRVKLDGTRTLGQTVEMNVFSPDFDFAKEPANLCELNKTFFAEKPCPTMLRDEKRGEFLVPVEVVRFVAAVPHADIPEGVPLRRLAEFKRACPSTYINSLERRPAVHSQAGADAPTEVAVDQAFQTMLTDISFPADVIRSISTAAYVGVAEDNIDVGLPDFKQSDGSTAFGDTDISADPPATTITIGNTFDDGDHGTAVAYLVGGRRHKLSDTRPAGLAPFAILVPLPQRLNAIEEAFARRDHNYETHVVNLSFQTQSGSDDGLSQLIKNNAQTLFVAAAGNTDRDGQGNEICEQRQIYPACLSDRDNVLVVGATSKEGSSLLAATSDAEGSNWSPTHVHVGAPGDGFYSAGHTSADGSIRPYVPVRGTSFAAPLVSAAAAALVSVGVSDAKQMKERIISTADYQSDLSGRFLAGTLNVRRAITNPRLALLVDGAGNEHYVEMRGHLPKLEIRGRNLKNVQTSVTLEFQRILRLQRVDQQLRVIYEDEVGLLRRLHGARITDPSTVPLSLVEHLKNGATKAITGVRLDDYADYIAPIR